MSFLYFLLGALLLFITLLDITKTVFSSNGGGRITNAISQAVWLGFFFAAGKKGTARLLGYAGSGILLSILLVWVLGLWLGFFFVLLSNPDSVVHSNTLRVADPLEKLYYAGFTLSTLGVGDYVASSSLWRLATSVASFIGLAFITSSITYFVPVLSAVALQTKLSLYIYSMGHTPQQILSNSWDGKGFSAFIDNVPDLCQMLMQHTVNHHAYPVIHYFQSSNPKFAIAPAIVLLSETHTLLGEAVSQEVKNNQVLMKMLKTALDSYLEMVEKSFRNVVTAGEEPPMPDLRLLREKGIPLRQEEEVKHKFLQVQRNKRKMLTSLLETNGWTWKATYSK